MHTEVTKKRFTIGEYHKMDEAGILGRDLHTELIDGEIIEVTKMGLRHAAVLSRVNHLWIADLRGDSLLVFRDPSTRTYKTSLSFNREDSIFCLALPDIRFSVQELLA
jgi:Uma2 family endonuclease